MATIRYKMGHCLDSVRYFEQGGSGPNAFVMSLRCADQQEQPAFSFCASSLILIQFLAAIRVPSQLEGREGANAHGKTGQRMGRIRLARS
jgi:hypothetical protein